MIVFNLFNSPEGQNKNTHIIICQRLDQYNGIKTLIMLQYIQDHIAQFYREYIGSMIKHYQHPHEPIRISWFMSSKGFFLAFFSRTVDGKYPAPVDMVNIPLLTRFDTSQEVVWDFFHQQYGFIGFLVTSRLDDWNRGARHRQSQEWVAIVGVVFSTWWAANLCEGWLNLYARQKLYSTVHFDIMMYCGDYRCIVFLCRLVYLDCTGVDKKG